MRRRECLARLLGGVAIAAAPQLAAHTPYKQWTVYRRKHLLIGCHKDDNTTYTLAQSLVKTLDEHLPDARARVARAPTAQRLASLLGTDQMDFALMSPANARLMAAGSEQFKPYGKIDLRLLHRLDNYALVCRASVPGRHAWLVADALGLNASSLVPATLPLPWHDGVQLLLAGDPVPVNE